MRLCASFTPWLLLALAVLNLATPGSAAAAAAKLTGGTVTPTTGTTATAFLFSVHFVGSATDRAVTVGASVAGGTVPLTLSNGDARNGTWTGSSNLPAGSWPVMFSAISSGGTNPTFGPTVPVVVSVPTPSPTPQPTPKPTAVPATSTPNPGRSTSPGPSPTPFGTTVTNPSRVPSNSETPSSSRDVNASPSPSGSPGAAPAGSKPFSVPLEGVVAIGLLGAVTVAAALGERRRRLAVEAFRAAQASPAGASPSEAGGPGDGWEHAAVDDETVATIDYETPDAPADQPNG
jgi:outer membrane biosynthesis protein TonB